MISHPLVAPSVPPKSIQASRPGFFWVGKLWENYGKTMGKLWENMGKLWENYGKTMGKP